MKVQYSTSKWKKEKNDAKQYDGVNSTLQNIRTMIAIFNKPDENSLIQIGDKITLYYFLGNEYKILASYEYLINENESKSFNYLSICMKYYECAYSLFTSGNTISNISVKKAIESKEFLNELAFIAIALDYYDLVSKHIAGSVIDCMYKGELEKARKIIEEMDYTKDEANEVYFTDVFFLKDIIISLCNRDEKEIEKKLIQRIKKYRRNMVGYSTIIDIITIAIVKIAKKLGHNISIKIVEIPERFMNNNVF